MTELIYFEQGEQIFKAFSGVHREWMLYTVPSRFSRPFSANSFNEIESRKLSLFGPNIAEYHFSVELYSRINDEICLDDRIGWTLIFDFDFGLAYQQLEEVDESNKKREAAATVSSLLDKFGVLYFMDSRNHLWIPDWETLKVQSWPGMFGTEFVVRLHQYLANVAKLPKGIYIDSNLWKASRHKIRAPYSYHIKSGERQILLFKGKRINIEDLCYYWEGEFLDKRQKQDYMDAFANFIFYADKCGAEIIGATTQKDDELLAISVNAKSYGWTEKLLEKPVPVGFRGLFLWLVIMPYLVNVKKLAERDVIALVHKWLDKSHGDRIRDSDLYQYPKRRYKPVKAQGIMPISLKNLMLKYPELYNCIRGE